MADIESKEVCSSQEFAPNLSLDDLSSSHIMLTLGNSRISETSLGSGPVLIVLQKSETLNQTNNSYCSFECHYNK